MDYPNDLTTSDWVDVLETLPDRDAKIACLATYHRRIEHASALSVLSTLATADGKTNEALQAAASAATAALPDLGDYVVAKADA